MSSADDFFMTMNERRMLEPDEPKIEAICSRCGSEIYETDAIKSVNGDIAYCEKCLKKLLGGRKHK